MFQKKTNAGGSSLDKSFPGGCIEKEERVMQTPGGVYG